MIIKEYGKYRAVCDNCENDLPPVDSYDEARKQKMTMKELYEDQQQLLIDEALKEAGR